MTDVAWLKARFNELFGGAAEFVVRAPGRVNLIGEHTDYNDGFVFPAAINYDIAIAGSRRNDRQVRADSLTFDRSTTFSLDSIESSPEETWSNYTRGVARILLDEGHDLKGLNAVIAGTVPIGSGLSSSAAMEVASCLAFETASGFELQRVKRALIGQRAEREFVGVNVGIMDQFISAMGVAGHALFIDTRTLGYEPVRLPNGVSVVVGDTRKKRGLVDSEYNARQRECEQAVGVLRRFLPGITALRDVTIDDFRRHESALPEIVRKRARHVITENARVLESVEALKSGDIATFGALMNESHDSLRNDYDVSCRELDVMVEAARKVDGVYGSRMTGAGFGGCTVSLVDERSLGSYKARVGSEYKAATGRKADFYICRASPGATRVE